MPEETLSVVLVALAFLGVVELVRRAFRSALRLAVHAAEATAASGLADVSERRGDLTGLAERRAHATRARRLRREELLVLICWTAWLVVPAVTGWVPDAYAAAALLWLFPRRPILRRPPAPEPG